MRITAEHTSPVCTKNPLFTWAYVDYAEGCGLRWNTYYLPIQNLANRHKALLLLGFLDDDLCHGNKYGNTFPPCPRFSPLLGPQAQTRYTAGYECSCLALILWVGQQDHNGPAIFSWHSLFCPVDKLGFCFVSLSL